MSLDEWHGLDGMYLYVCFVACIQCLCPMKFSSVNGVRPMAFVGRGVYDNGFLYDDVCTMAYGRSYVFDGVCLFNLSNAVPPMACFQ